MDFNQFVQETNAKFAVATPAEKRVIIAQDVIARLKVKNLIAVPGSFVYTKDLITVGDSLKDTVNHNSNQCSVCAKGALFCSFVGRVNKFTVSTLRDEFQNEVESSSHEKLAELFDMEQLDLIEIAFEGQSYLNVVKLDDFEEEDIVVKYFNTYENPDKRLVAIMENIIENKGTFIP